MKRIAFLLLLFVFHTSIAQIPQPKKNTFVNDYTGVLSNTDIQGLNEKIKQLETDHKVQLAIVLVNKIPADYDIQEFSLLIGRRWKVGTQQRGLVYVAALKQRKQRIEVARNLDAVLTTPKCMEILDRMKSSFKKEQYAAGLDILINNIGETLGSSPTTSPAAEPQTVQAPQSVQPQKVTAPKGKDDTLNLIIGFLVLAIPLFLIIRYFINKRRINKMQQQFYNSPNNPNYNGPVNYNNGSNPMPPYGSGGYSGNPNGNNRGTNWGGIAAGVIGGAAAGYAAKVIQDRLSDNSDNDQNTNADNNDFSSSADEQRTNYGNWGGNDSGSDSSSYDSGFSDSDSSSSSGATSDW